MPGVHTSVFALIRDAIVERKLVSAMYHGFRREMCPHVLGWKAGNERALFFQFAGGSRKGLSPRGEWRCLHLSALSDVSIYKGRWRTGPGYYENPQSCIDEIEVCVA
jgi:hypothetical protein